MSSNVTRISAADAARRIAAWRAGPGAAPVRVGGVDAAWAPASTADVAALALYRVPRITEDGTCGRQGDFEPQPFDVLSAVHGIAWDPAGPVEALPARAVRAAARLHALHSAMRALADATASEWAGVYRVVPDAAGGRTLVKEAYVGKSSRAYFPLTAEFAAGSNNSTVGLTGEAVVIGDTLAIEGDAPYYICDGAVRAEVCAPIVDAAGAVIGIVDVEAFRPRHFDDARVATVLDVCAQLGAVRLLVDAAEV